MPIDIKPFRVWYRDDDGAEKSVMVYAYDEQTAKSRAVHESAIEKYETITRAEGVGQSS